MVGLCPRAQGASHNPGKIDRVGGMMGMCACGYALTNSRHFLNNVPGPGSPVGEHPRSATANRHCVKAREHTLRC